MQIGIEPLRTSEIPIVLIPMAFSSPNVSGNIFTNSLTRELLIVLASFSN